MEQLQELIKMSDALKDMNAFLKVSNDQYLKLTDVGEYISKADLYQCKWMLLELADRVANLTGCCNHIEDAIYDIELCMGEE